ncbi:MAG: hypothetical protein HXS48_23450 [Theionarchaea archaeon]|nr:hypothetical protein [Theionarchaea archaeon]
MQLGQPLTLDDYYLWRKDTKRYPWQRQYLNVEFYKYERKRIVKAQDWYKKARRVGLNSNLDEISLYVVPSELSTSWKAAIAESGNFSYIGLSVLVNSPQTSLIGLIPHAVKQPQEYRLILVKKSKGKIVFNRRLNEPAFVTIIEEWEYLDSDYIYRDVPYERRIVSKIIREYLIDDKQISLSFQSPVMGAPYDGTFGGISLSSIAGDSSFAKELVKTIQLIVPPEYRTVRPPKSVYRGSAFNYARGIDFCFAERPYPSSNILSSICTNKYAGVNKELSKRRTFTGEFSIFSTINHMGNGTDVWKELLRNFTNTEVTLPENLDDLVEADVYLKYLRNVINEDLWIQVVHSRQYRPGMNAEMDDVLIGVAAGLKKDFDVLLSDIHRKEEDKEYLVMSLLGPSVHNLRRIAQSLARSDEKEVLNADYFKKARNLLIDNFTGFIEHPNFKKMREKMEASRADARFSVVQTEIVHNPRSSVVEIFQAVKSKGLFRDVYDLQGLLDWMKKKGYVIVDMNKQYRWV